MNWQTVKISEAFDIIDVPVEKERKRLRALRFQEDIKRMLKLYTLKIV